MSKHATYPAANLFLFVCLSFQGCDHDRQTLQKDNHEVAGTANGYQSLNTSPRFRTVMSYECEYRDESQAPCTFIEMFSNTVKTYHGFPTGDAQNDCASKIKAGLATIASYHPTKVTNVVSTPPATPVTPAPTPKPTAAPATCPSALTLNIQIVTDNFPGETSWEIVNKATSQVVVSKAQGSYTEGGKTYSESFCATSGITYIFRMKDKYGDGICCSEGNGSYSLNFGGSQIPTTAAFGSQEEKEFGTAGVSQPTPQPTPASTPNPTPGPTPNPTPGPTPNPTPGPTPNPTPGPTPNPTPGPIPPPTTPPTTAPPQPTDAPAPAGSSCESTHRHIKIELTTDYYPEETSWEILQGGTMKTSSAGTSLSASTKYVWNLCLPAGFSYVFRIKDSFGDGICCENGDGAYSLFVEGVQKTTNPQFGADEEIPFSV